MKPEIDTYILPSGSRKTDVQKTIEVCQEFAEVIMRVDSLARANEAMSNLIIRDRWNLILYDDEIPEPAFGKNIKETLLFTSYDVLVVFKRGKDQVPSKGPRLFRAGVAVRNDSINPVSCKNVGHYMDGFLLGIANYV